MNQPWVCLTRAAGGLGKAFAMDCAARGWDLCLTDVFPEKLERLAKGLMRLFNVPVLYDPFELELILKAPLWTDERRRLT